MAIHPLATIPPGPPKHPTQAARQLKLVRNRADTVALKISKHGKTEQSTATVLSVCLQRSPFAHADTQFRYRRHYMNRESATAHAPGPHVETAAVLQGTKVCHAVVVHEHAGGDVERDEAVDGVVLVRGEDEKYSEQVACPAAADTKVRNEISRTPNCVIWCCQVTWIRGCGA